MDDLLNEIKSEVSQHKDAAIAAAGVLAGAAAVLMMKSASAARLASDIAESGLATVEKAQQIPQFTAAADSVFSESEVNTMGLSFIKPSEVVFKEGVFNWQQIGSSDRATSLSVRSSSNGLRVLEISGKQLPSNSELIFTDASGQGHNITRLLGSRVKQLALPGEGRLELSQWSDLGGKTQTLKWELPR